MKKETRFRLIITLVVAGIFGGAILLGVVVLGLPWKSRSESISSSRTPILTIAQINSDPNIMSELINIENSSTLTNLEKSEFFLSMYPVFDGHNDLPWNIRKILGNKLENFDFTNTTFAKELWELHKNSARSHTDIPRLIEGHVGAQFWSVFVDCDSQGKDAVVQTLEQIDLITRLVEKYPDYLKFCTTASCVIETSFNKFAGESARKISSLIGIECGHSIQNSAAVLRQFYKLGVRYLTLTNECSTPWADSSTLNTDVGKNALKSANRGLSKWGLELIDEMNRIGMMVDLSHVSEPTMIAALKRSKAPVIFSHSGAKAVCDVPRNVDDEVLKLLVRKNYIRMSDVKHETLNLLQRTYNSLSCVWQKANGGIIMINFYSDFVYCGDQSKIATLDDVINHINHVRDVIGVDHIGLGGNYDGADKLPKGLEDVSKYPQLFARMIEKGWELQDLGKISFTNILRVMENVERVKKQLESNAHKIRPMESLILENELKKTGSYGNGECLSEKSLTKF